MSHDSWTAVQSTVILCTKVLPLNVCFSLQTFGFWRKTNVKFVLWIHTLKWSESDSIFHYSTSKTHAYAHPHIHIHIHTYTYIYLDFNLLAGELVLRRTNDDNINDLYSIAVGNAHVQQYS